MNAIWISPAGKIIDVKTKHINSVIDNPSMFKMNKQDIKQKYEKHDERLGVEGKAREEIMMSLMKRGWIRGRYIIRSDSWTLQTYYYGNREQNNIFDWAIDFLKNKKMSPHAGVDILITKSGRKISSSALKASRGQNIFETRKGELSSRICLLSLVKEIFSSKKGT